MSSRIVCVEILSFNTLDHATFPSSGKRKGSTEALPALAAAVAHPTQMCRSDTDQSDQPGPTVLIFSAVASLPRVPLRSYMSCRLAKLCPREPLVPLSLCTVQKDVTGMAGRRWAGTQGIVLRDQVLVFLCPTVMKIASLTLWPLAPYASPLTYAPPLGHHLPWAIHVQAEIFSLQAHFIVKCALIVWED